MELHFMEGGFNPRPRVGSDVLNCIETLIEGVSIHAPAWGATINEIGDTASIIQVSIHAPAWGATQEPARQTVKEVFQSTPPRGERLYERKLYGITAMEFQSTPPRGERRTRPSSRQPSTRFNPRPRVGSDNGHPRGRIRAL